MGGNLCSRLQETSGAPAGAARDPGLLAAQNSSITDRLEPSLTPTLKAEDLRSMTQFIRSLLQAGLVFATHQEEGRSRYARIILEDGSLYLHSLQDQPPPPGAATIKMDEVMPAAPPCLVFMDLAWSGSTQRRVLIRLSPSNLRGRQFLLLCTGQRGPCYANTRMLVVGNKGWKGEFVGFGDYEYNNGTGGAALLPDLGKNRKPIVCRAGAVWAGSDKLRTGAQFGINTSDDSITEVADVFGEVVGGLEVVEAAAQHTPVTEVTVVDCGVVLWE